MSSSEELAETQIAITSIFDGLPYGASIVITLEGQCEPAISVNYDSGESSDHIDCVDTSYLYNETAARLREALRAAKKNSIKSS